MPQKNDNDKNEEKSSESVSTNFFFVTSLLLLFIKFFNFFLYVRVNLSIERGNLFI